MKGKDLALPVVLVLALAGILLTFFVAMERSYGEPDPDFRDGVGAGVFVESQINSTVHTPIVSTIPAASAPFVSTLITSGTSAMAFTTTGTISTAFDILEARVHLDAAGATQTLTMTIDHGSGTEFDIVLLSQAMASETDVIFRPTRPVPVAAGSLFLMTWGNSGTKTWGGELFYVTP